MEKTKKVHKDCPFSHEELTAIKAELYFVNSTNHCANPPHPSWITAVEAFREQQERKDCSEYEKWLKNELEKLTEKL